MGAGPGGARGHGPVAPAAAGAALFVSRVVSQARGDTATAGGRGPCRVWRGPAQSPLTDGTPVCVFFSIGFLYGYTEDSIRSSALKPYRDVRFYTHRTRDVTRSTHDM